MENKVLLEIVKKSILKRFDKNITLDKEKWLLKHPYLANKTATFVTLNLNGELRGCIGTLSAYRSLLEDLISNSSAAAFEDPRFYELTKEEFSQTSIEISILTEAKELEYKDIEDLKSKIIPNIHGVILQKGSKRSTFLPQVWEMLPSFEEFFSNLCYKGGFDIDCLEKHPEIYVYEVISIK